MLGDRRPMLRRTGDGGGAEHRVRKAGRRRAAAARSLRRSGRSAGCACLPGSGRADPGISGRRHPRAGRRLPRIRELPRRIVRAPGRSAVSRSTRNRSRRRSRRRMRPRLGEADLATAQARLEKANNDVARYTPLVAEAGRQPEGARRRAGRAGRGALAGRRRDRSRRGQGGGGQGDARSRLRADHVADQRPGRHDAGEAGQSRRPGREHAVDDDLGDRPDGRPRRRHRGRLSPRHQARPEPGGPGSRAPPASS